jgi:aspartate aminotransferase
MFDHLHQIPLDPIFQLLADFNADPNPKKVNLGIGLYADHEGKPFVFPVIKKVFAEIDVHNFNYQPIGGNKDFLELVREFLFSGIDPSKLALHTTCGGTQACSLFRTLLWHADATASIIVGTPTWPNHLMIFKDFMIKKVDHIKGQAVNFEGYREALLTAEPGAILLLHGGLTHNPTGKNFSLDQLRQLIPLIRERGVGVFLDVAYLGFGEGIEQDRAYSRLLFEELDEIACGLSFSKNASLYEHRIGVLIIKSKKKKEVESQLQQLTRESISMAPGLGQEAMTYVLRDHADEWVREVDEVRDDMEARKKLLLDQLPEQFQVVRECRGMFGLLPLSKDQVHRLRKEFGVYLTDNARINFAGIKPKEVVTVGEAVRAVI